ncbi:hypothetical protein SELMODRAFT_415766 [Selaginella moellendorffii]|uniref:Uncharacterized protein n=1 Tax=Selaginella moellendorffii TaxID=88036 RepID=D8RX63_SELML|nr:hypothetical protein SELMODRAFT_415766 [Selaginella moellendorffii]
MVESVIGREKGRPKRPRYDPDGMEWLYEDEKFDVDDPQDVQNACYGIRTFSGERLEDMLMNARRLIARRCFEEKVFRLVEPESDSDLSWIEPEAVAMRDRFQDLVARVFFQGTLVGGGALIHPDGSILTSISCLPKPRGDPDHVFEVEFKFLKLKYSARAMDIDEFSFTAVLVPIEDQTSTFHGKKCFDRHVAVSDCDQILYAFQLGMDVPKKRPTSMDLKQLCVKQGITIRSKAKPKVSELVAALEEFRVIKMVCYDDIGMHGELALSMGAVGAMAIGCPVLSTSGRMVGVISAIHNVPGRAKDPPLLTFFGGREPCEFQCVADLKKADLPKELRDNVVAAKTIVEFANDLNTKYPSLEWRERNPLENFRKRRPSRHFRKVVSGDYEVELRFSTTVVSVNALECEMSRPSYKSYPKVVEPKERILEHRKGKSAAAAVASRATDNALQKLAEETKETAESARASERVEGLKQTVEEVKKQSVSQPPSVSTTSKRKKWFVTDPAEIAPHFYDKDLFRANFPLIDVEEIPEGHPFPVPDKFEGAVLDDEATRVARKKWISRLFDAISAYKAPENEKQAFPLHFAFLEPLQKLTRPSRYDLQKHEECCGKRKWRYEDIRDIGRPKPRKTGSEEHEGMYLEVPEPHHPGEDDSDDEEAVEVKGGLKDVPTGSAGGVIHVFDDPQLGITARGNPDKVAAVLERNFFEDKLKWNGRFRGGFYAVKHCLDNLRKGHGSVIYVLVMASATWTYGILVPEGCVEIRNGTIESESMEQFQKHQAMTGQSSANLEALQVKLKTGTAFYRRCYRDNPAAVYKDGPMLVGKFYLCSTWFRLPRMVVGGGRDPGGRRLFDGLLRLVIGDSVMDLTKEDFELRMRLRKEMKMQRQDAWFS